MCLIWLRSGYNSRHLIVFYSYDCVLAMYQCDQSMKEQPFIVFTSSRRSMCLLRASTANTWKKRLSEY